MAAMPSAVVKLLNKKTGDVDVFVYVLGTALGYKASNLHWIVKQANLETAYQTSAGYVERKNAFGMSEVNVRENTQIGAQRVSPTEVQGIYATVWDSVVDRFMWDNYWGMDDLRNSEDYSQRVSEIYHASAAYRDNVVATGTPCWTMAKFATWVSIPLEIFAIQKTWNYFLN